MQKHKYFSKNMLSADNILWNRAVFQWKKFTLNAFLLALLYFLICAGLPIHFWKRESTKSPILKQDTCLSEEKKRKNKKENHSHKKVKGNKQAPLTYKLIEQKDGRGFCYCSELKHSQITSRSLFTNQQRKSSGLTTYYFKRYIKISITIRVGWHALIFTPSADSCSYNTSLRLQKQAAGKLPELWKFMRVFPGALFLWSFLSDQQEQGFVSQLQWEFRYFTLVFLFGTRSWEKLQKAAW